MIYDGIACKSDGVRVSSIARSSLGDVVDIAGYRADVLRMRGEQGSGACFDFVVRCVR